MQAAYHGLNFGAIGSLGRLITTPTPVKSTPAAGPVYRELISYQDQQMAKKPHNVLTIIDLSAYLNISTSALYKLTHEERLACNRQRHWGCRTVLPRPKFPVTPTERSVPVRDRVSRSDPAPKFE
jgi:hypothetical protein